MKIQKFTEKYEFNHEDDISNEYSYKIISQYFDDIINEKSLQEAYDQHCEELPIEYRDYVFNSMLSIADNLKREIIKIQNSDEYYINKKANKYNI